MPQFPQQPIFCSLKAIESLNREQLHSPLLCHHAILVASIAVAFTPGCENAHASFFCGRLWINWSWCSSGYNTHTIMFDSDYNMMPQFFSTATNILLIKSNWKSKSRATALSVALSPCDLGGKYRSRLHPRLRKCACQFLAGDWACEIELCQTGFICFPWRQRSWSCGVFKSRISDAHCPFQWKWQFYTTMIYPCFSGSVCFSMGSPAWWRFGLCSSGSSLVSRWMAVANRMSTCSC